MKKIILAAAVVAAGVFAVMKATDINTSMNTLRLPNLELLAEGEATAIGPFKPLSDEPRVLEVVTTKETNNSGNSNSNSTEKNRSASGSAGFTISSNGGKVDAGTSRTTETQTSNNSSQQTEIQSQRTIYGYICIGKSGESCEAVRCT